MQSLRASFHGAALPPLPAGWQQGRLEAEPAAAQTRPYRLSVLATASLRLHVQLQRLAAEEPWMLALLRLAGWTLPEHRPRARHAAVEAGAAVVGRRLPCD